MYQKRTQVTRKLPLPRKGTKYVARAASNIHDSVPVVIAIRDMLKLAKTSKEVKKMINQKLLRINGKFVKDLRESISLFSIFEANDKYLLTILPTGRFNFEKTKNKTRIVKVINKKTLSGKKIQLNLHDGSNVLLNNKDKANVGDSLELDLDGKISKVIALEKGKEVFVISGRSVGVIGKIDLIKKNDVKIKFENKGVVLDKRHLIVK